MGRAHHPSTVPILSLAQASRRGRSSPTGHAPSISVNITPAGRAGRIILGAAAAVFGVVLLTAAGSLLAVVLEVLLVGAGLELIVTGTTGRIAGL